jgi:uncharacterized coiled-coil DUF342 family protein
MSDEPILAAIAALRSDMALRMDRFEAAQGSLRTELLGESVSTRAALMERMDRLQARMDQLHEECFTAFAQGETVRRHSDNTRAETRDIAEQVSSLVRQVRMLRTRLDQIEGP